MVYTDHKNLTYENFTTERDLIWRLLLEEYFPIIKYIKGDGNNAGGALISLPLMTSDGTESKITRDNLTERYCVKTLDGGTFPLTY